jgi:hypothetical protein
VPSGDHILDEQSGQMRQGCDINLDHIQVDLQVDLIEFSERPETGVVDQDFDLDSIPLQLIKYLPWSRGIGKIFCYGYYFNFSLRFQLFRCLP